MKLSFLLILATLPLFSLGQDPVLEKLGCLFSMPDEDASIRAFFLNNGYTEGASMVFTSKQSNIEIWVKANGEESEGVTSLTVRQMTKETYKQFSEVFGSYGVLSSYKKVKKLPGVTIIDRSKYTTGESNASFTLENGKVKFFVVWNKGGFVDYFTMSARQPYKCTEGIPAMKKREFSSKNFSPEKPESIFTMLNKSISIEDLEYLKKYYNLSSSYTEHNFIGTGTEFETGNNSTKEGLVVLSARMYLKHLPSSWTDKINKQIKVHERFGEHINTKSTKRQLLFYDADSAYFALEYDKSIDLAGDPKVKILVDKKSSFEFKNGFKPLDYQALVGCYFGECTDGFNKVYFGDGSYCLAEFEKGEITKGKFINAEKKLVKVIDKEKEEKDRIAALEREKERERIKAINAVTLERNKIVEHCNSAMAESKNLTTTMSEAFKLYREFSEAFEASYDKVGSLRTVNVNSAARMKAKNKYNALYDKLKSLRSQSSSVETHLNKADMCSNYESTAYFISLNADIAVKMLEKYNQTIWNDQYLDKSSQYLKFVNDFNATGEELEKYRIKVKPQLQECAQQIVAKYGE